MIPPLPTFQDEVNLADLMYSVFLSCPDDKRFRDRALKTALQTVLETSGYGDVSRKLFSSRSSGTPEPGDTYGNIMAVARMYDFISACGNVVDNRVLRDARPMLEETLAERYDSKQREEFRVFAQRVWQTPPLG